MTNFATFPHCDDLILHAPKSCTYCDFYPNAQQERIDKKINFTGENDPNKKQCPAEARRSLNTIYRWPNNKASPPKPQKKDDVCPKCGVQGQWVNLALVCPTHGPF